MYTSMKLIMAGWVLFSVYAAVRVAQDPVSRLKPFSRPVYYAIAMVGFIAYLRWPGVAWPGWLDPDESTTIGQAIRALAHPVPWLGFDSTTSGPLNSLVLIPIAGFAKPITLFDARFTGLLCWAGAWLCCYSAARIWFGEVAARVGLGLTGCFVALATGGGFVHFSSEQLPMFLLCGGWALFAWATVAESLRNKIWLGWLAIGELTLVPLAKPQGGPIAVAFALLVLWWGWRQTRSSGYGGRYIFGAVLAGLLAPVMLLVWVLSQGGGEAFMYQFVRWNFQYTQGFIAGPATGLDWVRGFAKMVIFGEEYAAYIWGTVLAAALFALVLLRRGVKVDVGAFRGVVMGIWLVGSFICIMIPNKGFPHYLCFFVFPLGALLALVASWWGRGIHVVSRWQPACAAVIVASAIFPLIKFSLSQQNPYHQVEQARYRGVPEAVDQMLTSLNPLVTDRLAIWGWVPEVFVLSQLTPSSPFIPGQACIPNVCPVQRWYRERFRACILQEKPRFFLDAIAPGAQGYGTLFSEPHEADPELTAIIRLHYKLVGELRRAPEDLPVRLYELQTMQPSTR